MTDIYDKIRIAGQLVREISDEIGYTVRLSYRQPDHMGAIGHGVMIEGDIPNGYVYGTGSPDKALGEAMARLDDALGIRKAA